MIKVAVAGAAGRMGTEVLRAVSAANDLQATAAIDPFGEDQNFGDTPWFPSVAEMPDGTADVLVDFTVAEAARSTLPDAVARGIHAVVGTTGLGDEDVESLRQASEGGGGNVLIAANFALGAVLAMRFAVQAAPYFDSVEIIELHHDAKIDAPSGTSIATARRIADERERSGRAPVDDPTTSFVIDGARGGSGPGGIAIHSVRLPGLVAHEEILFGSPGEGLTIRHDSYARTSFMGGVVLAVREIHGRPGVTLGLDALLDT